MNPRQVIVFGGFDDVRAWLLRAAGALQNDAAAVSSSPPPKRCLGE
jgi:hypothetical protein